jgi:alpha/beta superfamily hydrolase
MKRLIIVIMALCLLGGAGISEARYIDNGNGTVSDTQTCLMWQQATAPGMMKWNDANAWVPAV